jgi:hypothetical protein
MARNVDINNANIQIDCHNGVAWRWHFCTDSKLTCKKICYYKLKPWTTTLNYFYRSFWKVTKMHSLMFMPRHDNQRNKVANKIGLKCISLFIYLFIAANRNFHWSVSFFSTVKCFNGMNFDINMMSFNTAVLHKINRICYDLFPIIIHWQHVDYRLYDVNFAPLYLDVNSSMITNYVNDSYQ